MATKKDDSEEQETRKTKIYETNEEAQQRIAKLLEKNEAIQNRTIKSDEKKLELLKQKLALEEQYGNLTEEDLKKQEEAIKKLEKKVSLQADLTNSITNQFNSLTGMGGPASSIVGKMIQMKGAGGSISEALKNSLGNIRESLSLWNIAAKIVDKIVESTIALAKEQDKAYAEFEKEVGNVKKYEDQIMSLRRSNGLYGISVADAAKQFIQFKQSFGGFESMSQKQQTTLATTAAQLGKLGISTEDVVRTQDLLVKGMGMSVQQSTNLQKSLYATANAMGIPPKQMASDFAKAAPYLAAQGKNMQKVFLDLQNSSKATGIEFNRLLDITKKFDTFEGAATSAGELNAILGGDYLNSIDMLNASEGDRVKMIQESLKASGKSLDMMSKQEQQAVANSLGLSDVAELQKLMNNETAKGTVEAVRAEKAQKQMNAAIEDAQELGQMWNNLMAKLAFNLRPVVELLKSIVGGLLGFFDNIGKGWDNLKEFVGGIESLNVGFGKLSGIWTSVKEFFSGINEYFKGIPGQILAVIGALGGLWLSWKLIKFIAESVIKGIAKTFAETLQTIAGPVGDAAKTIGKGIGEGFDAASKGISAAIGRIGSAFKKNAVGIAIGVLALIGIASALYITAKALMLFASISWESIAKAGVVLLGLVLAVAALGALVGNPIAAALLAAGVIAIMGIGVAVMILGYGIKALGDGLANISKSFENLINVMKNISGIEDNFDKMLEFVEDLADIDVGPIIALASAMNTLAVSMEKISKIKKIDIAGPSMFNAGTAGSNINTTTAAAGGGGTNLVPVAIYIDSKKVGEILDPQIKQTIQASLKNINGRMVPV